MNRRTAIRNVAIFTAGAALLPSCMHPDKPSITLRNIPLTAAQENMLAELTETILPKTGGFIGAKDLRAHEFVLVMADDCISPEEQQPFIAGLQQFDEWCRQQQHDSFIQCNPQQRKALLQQLEAKQDAPEQVIRFYETTKRFTIQSFVTSKPYMTGIRNYKMVPGPVYKGCVAI